MTRPYRVLPLLALLLAGAAATAAELSVDVVGVRHDRGQVRVDLYAGPTGFPAVDARAAARVRPAAAGTVSVRFPGLAAGRYALIAYHDENGDGKMNRLLGMMPIEPYGLSNNPQVTGPPDFEDAAFDLPAEGAALAIRLNH